MGAEARDQPGPDRRRSRLQLRARGVDYPREGDLARDAVIALGVPADAVTVLPGAVDNTAAGSRRAPTRCSPPAPSAASSS